MPWRYLGRSFLRADDMAGSRDPGHYQDSGCPIQPDAKTITKGQTLSPDKTGGGLAAQCSPGLAVGVLVIAAVVLVGLCFNTRVFFGGATEADTLVSSPVGPLGDLSETRGEACDASQILSDRAENHKRVLFTKLVDA